MKLLFISSEFPPGPGGIAMHAFSLLKAVPKSTQIVVLTNQDWVSVEEKKQFNALLPSNMRIKIFINRKIPGNKALRILQAIWVHTFYRPNKVIVSGKFPLWVGGIFKILHVKVPVTGILHGSEAGNVLTKELKITQYFYKKLDRIVAVSNFTAAIVSDAKIKGELVVVPNGLDDIFLTKGKASFAHRTQPTGLVKFLTVGNLTKRKGQHRFIKALPKLKAALPEFQYSIIGLPTLKEETTQLLAQLQVAKYVSILGKLDRPGVEAAFAEHQIFIMLSENQPNGDIEGFGIAILEANAYGIPAIGAKGCGIEDAITDKTGVLVDGDSAEEICAAVQKIVANYNEYSKNARSWAEAHRWEQLISQIVY